MFEGLYDEGTSDEPEVLLEDARYALRNGDPQKAVTYLERALAIDSMHTTVRVELSAALLQANDIDILVLKDLALFVDNPPTVHSSIARTPENAACNFIGNGGSALHFEDDASYSKLETNMAVLKRGLVLLREAAIEGGITQLSDLQLSTVYLVRAISRLAVAVIQIKTRADRLNVSFYRTDGGLGYCAPSQEALEAIESYVLCEQVPCISDAITDLTQRQSLLGRGTSSAAEEVLEAVSDIRDELSGTIQAACTDQF